MDTIDSAVFTSLDAFLLIGERRVCVYLALNTYLACSSAVDTWRVLLLCSYLLTHTDKHRGQTLRRQFHNPPAGGGSAQCPAIAGAGKWSGAVQCHWWPGAGLPDIWHLDCLDTPPRLTLGWSPHLCDALHQHTLFNTRDKPIEPLNSYMQLWYYG